jgi:hypothetical protein
MIDETMCNMQYGLGWAEKWFTAYIDCYEPKIFHIIEFQ